MKKVIKILEIALLLTALLVNICYADIAAPRPGIEEIIDEYLPIIGIIIAVVLVLAAVYAVIKANETNESDQKKETNIMNENAVAFGSAPSNKAEKTDEIDEENK